MNPLIISLMIMSILLVVLLPIDRFYKNPYKFKDEKKEYKQNYTEGRWSSLLKLAYGIGKNMPDRYILKRDKLIEWIKLSGLEGTVSIETFVGIKIIVLVLILFYFLMMYALSLEPINIFLMVIGGGLSGLAVNQWLYIKVITRQRMIQRDVPTILGTVAILMDAGLNLIPAIEEAASQHKGMLSDELKKAIGYISIGLPQEDAFTKLSDRCQVDEVSYFVSAILQGLEKGSVGLAEIVRQQASESWEKRMHRAKQLAEKASVKLFMPLLFLVFPAVIIFLLGPMVFSIMKLF